MGESCASPWPRGEWPRRSSNPAQEVLKKKREQYALAREEVEKLLGDILGGVTQERLPGIDRAQAKATFTEPSPATPPRRKQRGHQHAQQ